MHEEPIEIKAPYPSLLKSTEVRRLSHIHELSEGAMIAICLCSFLDHKVPLFYQQCSA